MTPYIVTSATLTDYEGRTLQLGALRDSSGAPIIFRRPLLFTEDEIIAQLNNALPGRLFVTAKLNIKQLF